MYQIVYKFPDWNKENSQPKEMGRIKNGRIYGPEAGRIKELLVEGGWPERPPHWAIHGSIFWATLPILEDGETPENGWVQNENFLWERDVIQDQKTEKSVNLTNPQV